MSNELTLYFLALQSEAPAENLIRLLIHLKNAGVTQNEALQLLSDFEMPLDVIARMPWRLKIESTKSSATSWILSWDGVDQ